MHHALIEDTLHIGHDAEAYRLLHRRWSGLFDQAGLSWIAQVITAEAHRRMAHPAGREQFARLVNELMFGFGVSLLELAGQDAVSGEQGSSRRPLDENIG